VVDDTQFEPSSKYYDPKARRDAPIWICVDVAYVATLPRLLSLDDLRAEPRLADLVVLRRGSRLSVQPVTAEQFAMIAAMGQNAIEPASISRAPRVAPRAKVESAPKFKAQIKPRARAAKSSAKAARTRR
jgi:EVE domain